MTESVDISSLADHHICSTIKTLVVILPKPSSMDRGPRIGVTEAEFYFIKTLSNGLGAGRGWWPVDRGPWLMD